MKYRLGYKYDYFSITLYLENKKDKIPCHTTFHRLTWDEKTITNMNDFIENVVSRLVDNAKLNDFLFSINRKELEKTKKDICVNFSKYLRAKNELLDVSIKAWYIENYPNDELGEKLSNCTFKDLNNLLMSGFGDVYAVIGYSDSLVRERCFEKLAEITEQPYENIYNKWLCLEDIEEELDEQER